IRRLSAGELGSYRAEVRYVRKDGTVVPVEVVATSTAYGGRAAVQFVARDITARKQAEEEREKLQLQLHQAMKLESIGRLAGGVAHDFNNLLQAIIGYTSLAFGEVQQDSPLHEYLAEIEKAANRAAALTRQLVTFARKQTIQPVVVDFNLIVETTLSMLKRLIGENIQVEWIPAKDLWHVKIDPVQIDQVLANLVINARDAISGTGKITVETSNVVIDKAYAAAHAECIPGEYVLLAVSDTGCGMDKQVMSHLFEPFFTTKPKGVGTGLGLATVFGIVKQNGGFINVYSEPGRGSTFKVYLPRALGEPVRTTVSTQAQLPRGDETILLVEDEEQIVKVGKTTLEGLGYKVITARTPLEALTLASSYLGKIDILLTDVIMPDMSGAELREKILAIHPKIRTIFMSGYTENAIVRNGVLKENIIFLQKPFTAEEIARKIRETLDKP
ncbi:MAG: ATP-binding protein, partial [Verrucomicrobiae bacterium]|nr:ATP-binding protein [Verrucomicrobiae bacterium]